MIFRSKKIYTPDGIIDGYMEIENGKILKIVKGETKEARDLGDLWIIPGIFDTHNHAYGGYNLSGRNDEERSKNIKGYLKALASLGVTLVFPSVFSTVADQRSLEELETAASFVGKRVDGAKAAGIHFEGPFLHRVGEHGQQYKPDPIDLEYAKKCIEVSNGTLKLMGHAPELPGSRELIDLLLRNGVTAAFTHSDSKSEEAFRAFDDGVTVATHTCNVMVGIHHRNVGGLGAALIDNRVYCELICDGLHVCNDMLKLIMNTKPHDHIMMVSDTSTLAGAPSGKYMTDDDGLVIVDQKGRLLEESGRLSGSSKPVLYGMKNLVRNVGMDLLEIVKLSSLNPCIKYGYADCKGSLSAGKDADFVLIDSEFGVVETYSEGRKIYDCKEDKDLLRKEYFENARIS